MDACSKEEDNSKDKGLDAHTFSGPSLSIYQNYLTRTFYLCVEDIIGQRQSSCKEDSSTD